jgi:hypothetical protein
MSRGSINYSILEGQDPDTQLLNAMMRVFQQRSASSLPTASAETSQAGLIDAVLPGSLLVFCELSQGLCLSLRAFARVRDCPLKTMSEPQVFPPPNWILLFQPPACYASVLKTCFSPSLDLCEPHP